MSLLVLLVPFLVGVLWFLVGLYVIPCLLHVLYLSGRGWGDILHKDHLYIRICRKLDFIDGLEEVLADRVK